MAIAIGTIGHEDRLSLVGHLEELRTRLIVSLTVLAVAFAVCFWQNHTLLHVVNAPLQHQTREQTSHGEGLQGPAYEAQKSVKQLTGQVAAAVAALQLPGNGTSAATRSALRGVETQLRREQTQLSPAQPGEKPVTLGIGEPLTATIGVTLIFALILAAPVILYELYGFILPAFSPRQRSVATPLILAVPFLFVTGVLFGYFIVLPSAIHFLQNFNSGQFDTLVQASQYYHFAAVTLLAMGLVFQVPVGVLTVTRMGIATSGQLRSKRRYALLACAAVAAFLPGDFVTLLLETLPLYLLFEVGVLLASIAERRERRRSSTGSATPDGIAGI
jgi:sec-independent protein translocase protein TatC